jgi:outer membrane protein assembly factor BamA
LLLRLLLVASTLLVLRVPAFAGDPRPLTAIRVEGDTKVTETTALRLAHVALGSPITPEMAPQLEATLLSSQLFKTVEVRIEDAPDGAGYVLVATFDDKLSWIVAPTLYLLPSSYSFGAGYAENNLFGDEKKLLLYGQYGNRTSLFFGTYLDPAVRGSRLILRFDVYYLHRALHEYKNPSSDTEDYSIDRSTNWDWFDLGLLAGWRFRWWMIGDVRFKPAYAKFSSVETNDPALRVAPEQDGRDISVQARLTIDARKNRYGVTWGPYLQLFTDVAVPGLDEYGYQLLTARAYYSWHFLDEHQLELRVGGGIGRHLPVHEEMTLGGVGDVRGYITDQFRGDRRLAGRVEYSFPIAKWRTFAFRAIGFYDVGTIGFGWRDPETRAYLPTQANGSSWTRSDAGVGFRIYVGSVVLPLLGLDLAYGFEGRRPEVVFEVGITDF